jgi:hypothetical protein
VSSTEEMWLRVHPSTRIRVPNSGRTQGEAVTTRQTIHHFNPTIVIS